MLKAFRDAAVEILQRGIILQHSALHLEIIDAPGKRIGERLEHEQRKRLTVIILALDALTFAVRLREAHLRVFIRMREHIGHKRQQAGGSYIARKKSSARE